MSDLKVMTIVAAVIIFGECLYLIGKGMGL